jgi:DNA modification methylase
MKDWPASKITEWPVAKLRPYERNARTHSPEQIAQITQSIREFGFTSPILIEPTGSIIAGHGRLAAAKIMGLKSVPVMVARGWSQAQVRAYVIADNKIAENAGWDEELLKIELGAIEELGFDLSVTGFSADELAAINALGADRGHADPDDVPDSPTEPVTKPGDVWLLGSHRLVCGDCTDKTAVRAAVGRYSPHLLVSDPPYGVDYDPTWRSRAGVNGNKKKLGLVRNDDRADWRQAWALFEGDVTYVWHGGLHASAVAASLEACGFVPRAQLIWAKERFALGRGDYHWRHEPCWYAVRKGGKSHWQGGRDQDTVWQIAAREDAGHGHGTQKPVECMKRPIENNSKAGDHIYDPFVGSGTTIIAGEMTGRAVHAIEIDAIYVDITVQRWQNFTGRKAVLEGINSRGRGGRKAA